MLGDGGLGLTVADGADPDGSDRRSSIEEAHHHAGREGTAGGVGLEQDGLAGDRHEVRPHFQRAARRGVRMRDRGGQDQERAR